MAPKPKSARRGGRNKRPLNGFLLGAGLIGLALVLMFIRTYYAATDWQTMKQTVQKKVEEGIAAVPEGFKQVHKKMPGWHHPADDLEKTPVAAAAHNPSKGARNAPVQIVLFNDPGCAQCQGYARQIEDLHGQYGAEVRIVYKFLPNPTATRAVEGALFGQMAHQKDLFWAYHDKLLGRDLSADSPYADVLLDLGMDLDTLRRDLSRNSEQYLRLIEKDVATAKSLGLDAPPVMYINGYKIGQENLPYSRVEKYVHRLVNGERILADDRTKG